MNPDDFEREPRSGNTHLRKLNKNLKPPPPKKKKKKTKLTISLSVPPQLSFHSTKPKTIAMKPKTQTHNISTHFLNATAKLFINFSSLLKIS